MRRNDAITAAKQVVAGRECHIHVNGSVIPIVGRLQIDKFVLEQVIVPCHRANAIERGIGDAVETAVVRFAQTDPAAMQIAVAHCPIDRAVVGRHVIAVLVLPRPNLIPVGGGIEIAETEIHHRRDVVGRTLEIRHEQAVTGIRILFLHPLNIGENNWFSWCAVTDKGRFLA